MRGRDNGVEDVTFCHVFLLMTAKCAKNMVPLTIVTSRNALPNDEIILINTFLLQSFWVVFLQIGFSQSF